MSANVAWEARKLNELGYVGRGKSRHRPRNDPSLYGGRYPFFQTGDIKEAEFHLRSYQQTYNETGLAQSRLWQPGTLCITIAANIAETAILAVDGCFPDSVVGFIADPAKADVRYVKYYIDYIKVKMQSISRGTTQDNLSVDKLLTFDILTPPLPTQRKIADILSAYDDLIENNIRRIKILEEMAQAMYREWFVKFRFPGHEQVAMVETDLGVIPEGWEAVPMSSLFESYMGGEWGSETPTSQENSRVSIIRGTDFKDVRYGGQLRTPVRFIAGPSLEKRQLREGDIIVENSVNASSRSIGSSLLVTRGVLQRLNHQAVCASFCKNFRLRNPKLAPLVFLFMTHLYSEGKMRFYQHVATNGIGNFQAKRFVETEAMILPRNEVTLGQLVNMLAPLTTTVFGDQIANLRQTRDLLLPRLVSGEIEVQDRGERSQVQRP